MQRRFYHRPETARRRECRREAGAITDARGGPHRQGEHGWLTLPAGVPLQAGQPA